MKTKIIILLLFSLACTKENDLNEVNLAHFQKYEWVTYVLGLDHVYKKETYTFTKDSFILNICLDPHECIDVQHNSFKISHDSIYFKFAYSCDIEKDTCYKDVIKLFYFSFENDTTLKLRDRNSKEYILIGK